MRDPVSAPLPRTANSMDKDPIKRTSTTLAANSQKPLMGDEEVHLQSQLEHVDLAEDLDSSLHPLSSPTFPDAQPSAERTNSHNSRNSAKRPQYSFRVAEAARAAKQKLSTHRWSFHRRSSMQSERSTRNSIHPTMAATASQVSMDSTAPRSVRQESGYPLQRHPVDFMSPSFTSPLMAAAPLMAPPPSQPPMPPAMPPAMPHMETIDIPVKSWILQGNGTAPRKSTRLSAWSKKLGPSRTVRVECNPSGLAPIVLYASDQVLTSTRVEPFKTTESITSRPEYVDKQSIVYRDSPFEIGVVGMSISGQDFKLGYPDYNEVLMYSMQREPGEQGEEGDALPYIHYDPTQDDKLRGTEPDQFIPIPASKSLFMASDGDTDPAAGVRKSVNCRFKVLELDAVDEMMQMSLAGIEQLGNHVQQYSAAAPALGLLSPAISLASMVSKRALESHAKPDKVIMIDMNFLLAERQLPEMSQDGMTEIPFESRSGEYLRYGYYFFLERGVEAKLYASFRTFPNVSLMMKRVDKPGPNEKQFFPLTGVSYLVIRVTPRLSSMRATRRAVRLRHVQKLEQLMKSALLATVKGYKSEEAKLMIRMLSELGEELGIIQREASSEKRDEGLASTLFATGSKGIAASSKHVNEMKMSRFSDRGRRVSLSDWPSGSGLERFSASLARARALASSTSGLPAERSSSMSTLDSNSRDKFMQFDDSAGLPGLPAPRMKNASRSSSDF